MKIRVSLLILSFVILLVGCRSSERLANDSHSIPVKAMSFNIRYGTANDGEHHWEMRKGLVMRVIREYDADFIGLQEALRFQIDEIREAFPGYDEIGIGRMGGTEGEYSAILYKTDRFSVLKESTYWLSETPEVPSTHWGNKHLRICAWGLFEEKESGGRLYFYNTHWDHREQLARLNSASLMVDRIKAREGGYPFLVTGDFNAGEDNEAISKLKSGGVVGDSFVVDTFRIKNPDAKVVGTMNGFRARLDGDKIDYVFAQPGVEVVEASIVTTREGVRTPSDHYPVTAEVEIGVVK